MKRINPETGEVFKQGDTREDGYIFMCYRVSLGLKKDGTYYERWYRPVTVDKDKVLKSNWQTKNPDKHRSSNKEWASNNKPYILAKEAKRRSSKLQRTPSWLTPEDLEKIQWKYNTAKHMEMLTGKPYHVDHVVPLQGEMVSGLHTPNNLQVIPAKDNLSKSNKFEGK